MFYGYTIGQVKDGNSIEAQTPALTERGNNGIASL